MLPLSSIVRGLWTVSYLTYFWTSNKAAPGCVEFTDKDYGKIGYLDAGGYSVPIVWSMCFNSTDVHVCEQESAPDEEMELGISCDTERTNAISRLEKRMPSLLKILPLHMHDVPQVFLDRLRQSSESFVHMDLSVLVSQEEQSEVESWGHYWGKLLDGLDTPVGTVRTGLAERLLGPGLPPGWKDLCRWSVGNASLRNFMSANLTAHEVSGAHIDHLREWQA